MSLAPEHLAVAQRAFALHQQGHFEEALALIEPLLTLSPPQPALLNLAAVCARPLGLLDRAETYLRSAIEIKPDHVAALCNLGLVLSDAGRLDEAEAAFLKTLELIPNDPNTAVNLGNLYRATKRPVEAERVYRDALGAAPDNVNALYNLGLLLAEQDRHDEAEAAYRQSLKIQPRQADVHNDLGNVLMDRLRFDEAEDAYRKAIALWPEYVDARFNLAILLLERRRLEEAWSQLQHCLRLQPDHANALNAMGNLLSQTGKWEEAEKAYRHSLNIRPDSANIHGNLGNLLMELNRFPEAEAEFRQAVALEPTYGYALGHAANCARRNLDWSHAATDEANLIAAIERGISDIPPRILMSMPAVDARLQLEATRLASQGRVRPFLDKPPVHRPPGEARGAPLRIGYLSADFREHAVMYLLGGVFELHDRTQFKIHAYSIGPSTNDLYRERVETNVEVFRDVRRMSDEEAAEAIAGDGIDILVDLTGNTKDYRPGITAARPAPIIVNWLGYPGTLGHARLADYIIGDPIATPASQAEFFSETLAQMPHCCLPNDAKRPIGPTPTREEEGLPAGALVFASFNQGFKLTPEVFDIWCRLLREVPDSVLWMMAVSDVAAENLKREAGLRGVAPERIIFAQRKRENVDHLARLRLADLALDSFPYTYHSSGCDLLWAGVPFVTRIGATFASRIAASLLHAVGLPELVAASWDAYFDLAHRLATRPDELAALREKLASGRLASPLFDTARFTRDLETLYSRMWAQHRSGQRAPLLAS